MHSTPLGRRSHCYFPVIRLDQWLDIETATTLRRDGRMYRPFISPHRAAILGFWSCALVVFILALVPPTESIPSTGWDVNDHVLAFSILTVLGCLAYQAHLVNVIVGLVAYGSLIEILQSFTSYRVGEWSDLLSDCTGIAIGYVFLLLLRKARTYASAIPR
jgi:VanZ family protein